MPSKVCILAAGKGSRMGSYAQTINKSLLSLNGKAIISHIIEKFSSDTEFIVAVGHRAQQVKDYLSIAHANSKITFAQVLNYEDEGSGPGLSLAYCREALSESPFYLVTCDTLWTDNVEALPTDRNWLAVASVSKNESAAYCNVICKDDRVFEIRDKTLTLEQDSFAWTGLSYIHDTASFWSSLKNNNKNKTAEKQISDGYFGLLEQSNLYAYIINWTDVGTYEKYKKELHRYELYDFSKVDEQLYFVKEKVIKYFENKSIAESRAKKAKINTKVFPRILDAKNNFYSYSFVNGETLYNFESNNVFKSLLEWLDQNLWVRANVDSVKMQQLCHNFYYAKTFSRNQMYLNKKYPEVSVVNGQIVPSADELLKKIDWKQMSEGVPYFIHGDLQPDNIIYDASKKEFCLLDWRQDFSGVIEYGDIYYDFAKLLGGIMLSYQQVKLNNFSFKQSDQSCEISFQSHANFEEFRIILKDFVVSRGYSFKKIQTLVGLIYINMSPLHHAPFDQFLHAMGRKQIHESLG